jgi:hypothetical protein
MAEEAEPGTPPPSTRLRRGTQVEVRSGYDDSWQQGFVVEEPTGDGYVLRRASDDTLLPPISAERVRRERSRETWWV